MIKKLKKGVVSSIGFSTFLLLSNPVLAAPAFTMPDMTEGKTLLFTVGAGVIAACVLVFFLKRGKGLLS